MNDNKLMENLSIYNKLKVVPDNAKKPIKGGRLKGYTDINPMWRIKALTEQFGVCGIGWYPKITKQWLEPASDGISCAFVNVELHIKHGDEWGVPIEGTGGSHYIEIERNGLYVSDDCFKMALTDAISVCCKMLGMAADVYFEKDKTKYTKDNPEKTDKPDDPPKKVDFKLAKLIKYVKYGFDVHGGLDKFLYTANAQSLNELSEEKLLKTKIWLDEKVNKKDASENEADKNYSHIDDRDSLENEVFDTASDEMNKL